MPRHTIPGQNPGHRKHHKALDRPSFEQIALLLQGGRALCAYYDTVRTLRHPEVLQRPEGRGGVFTFDLGRDGRE